MVEHKQVPVGPGPHTAGRFRRRRRFPVPVEPARKPRIENGRFVIVQERADFVCCSYQGCGALRPIADAADGLPCAACNRV